MTYIYINDINECVIYIYIIYLIIDINYSCIIYKYTCVYKWLVIYIYTHIHTTPLDAGQLTQNPAHSRKVLYHSAALISHPYCFIAEVIKHLYHYLNSHRYAVCVCEYMFTHTSTHIVSLIPLHTRQAVTISLETYTSIQPTFWSLFK